MRIMERNEKKEPATRRDPSQLNAIEKFYEKFRGVPLKYIDIFIGVCVTAFLVVVILGMLRGRGIL